MKALIIAVGLLGWAPIACGQETPPNPTVEDVKPLLEKARRESSIPGISVALARDGQVFLAQALGFADLENQVEAHAGTRFRTASIAKPMTAVLALQLAEAGQLDLDAPIRKWISEWPERHAPITTRQLMGHLGGVRHYKRAGEADGTQHYENLSATLPLFRDDDLKSAPGSTYLYTTYGYTLVGLVVERASGKRFEDLVAERIWGRSSMAHTSVDHHFAIIPHRSRGYRLLDKALWDTLPRQLQESCAVGSAVNAALHDTSMKIPGGGFLSTPSDLCRFGLALCDETLLTAPSKNQMWTEQKTTVGKETGYGLGWGVRREGGRLQISHSGGQAGASCFLVVDPGLGRAAAVMCNLQGASLANLTRQLLALMGS